MRRAADEKVIAAFAAKGGISAVHRRLLWMDEFAFPLAAATILHGARLWKESVESDEFDYASRLSDAGNVVIVQPHLGSGLIIALHTLISSDRALALMFWDPSGSNRRLWRTLGKYLGVNVEQRVRLVDAGSVMAPTAFAKLIQRGAVGLWQPDARIYGGHRPVPCDFMGLSVEASPFVSKLINATKARAIVAHERIVAGSPRFKLRAAELRLSEDPVTRVREVYGAVERTILANIDQWTRWRVYPHI